MKHIADAKTGKRCILGMVNRIEKCAEIIKNNLVLATLESESYREVPLPIGTVVEFNDYVFEHDKHMGRLWQGVITSRQIPTPDGFIGGLGFAAFYNVEVFVPEWGYNKTCVVYPDRITRINGEK